MKICTKAKLTFHFSSNSYIIRLRYIYILICVHLYILRKVVENLYFRLLYKVPASIGRLRYSLNPSIPGSSIGTVRTKWQKHNAQKDGLTRIWAFIFLPPIFLPPIFLP